MTGTEFTGTLKGKMLHEDESMDQLEDRRPDQGET
jgi:hypothetical protein